MLPQTIEKRIVDAVCIEGQLLGEGEGSLLAIIKGSAFEVHELLELLFGSAEPRDLRGV